MLWRRKKVSSARATRPLRELLEGSQGLAIVIPPRDRYAPANYISLPLNDIPEWVKLYVTAMETQETNEWCRCEWIVHPDDTLIVDHRCRECNRSKDHDVHDIKLRQSHEFRGKRMRRGDQADDCPVHTKEGFLIYFFQWVMDHAND